MVAPRHDPAGDHQHEHCESCDITPVTRPKLEQIVSTELLVDLAKDVAHKSPDRPWPELRSEYPLICGEANPAGNSRTSTAWARRFRRLDATREIVNTV